MRIKIGQGADLIWSMIMFTPFAGRAVSLAILVLLHGCAATPRTQQDPALEKEKAEVIQALNVYYRDFSSRRWTAFATHFWPGATITTIWRPPGEEAERVVATSLDEFIRQAPLGPDSRSIFEERMTGAEVRICGPLAQVWATYDAKFGDPGDIAEWSGIDAFTLMKHDGRWRIVSLAFAGDS
jgi:hypothetical protein